MNKLNVVVCGILLSVCPLFFSSCGGDDSNDIEGTYQITLYEEDCPGTINDATLENGANDVSGIVVNLEGTMTFTQSGNYTVNLTFSVPLAGSSDTLLDSGTYELNGNTLTTCSNSAGCESETYTLSSNTLTVSTVDGACRVSITGKRI